MSITPEIIESEKQKLQQEDLAKFPSAFQMARNLVKQSWLSAKAAVIEGRGLIVDAEKANARLAICQGCEFYTQRRCIKCGCFMEAKAQFVAAICPINRWGENTTPVTTLPNPPVPEHIHNTTVDLETLPEPQKTEMTKLASESLRYDGRFGYDGKQYIAAQKGDGTIVVKHFTPPRRLTQSFTAEEKAQFDALVQQNSSTEEKKFEFKDYTFEIKFKEDGKMYIQSAPKAGHVDA